MENFSPVILVNCFFDGSKRHCKYIEYTKYFKLHKLNALTLIQKTYHDILLRLSYSGIHGNDAIDEIQDSNDLGP